MTGTSFGASTPSRTLSPRISTTLPPCDSISERGGFKEAIINVKGDGAYRHLRFEGGGHRVQRVPETEAQGRIHTSAATVAVLPELPDVKVDINPKDV